MWYKQAKKHKENAVVTIIRRLIEQQVRKRLFLQGDAYVPKEDIRLHVDRIMKELLNKYEDFDLIRQKENIFNYDNFVKELVEKKIPIFQDKKPTRKAGYGDDGLLFCDICEIGEDEDPYITYDEESNKHLCQDCMNNLERERGDLYQHNAWERMSPQERDDAIKRS